MATELEADVLEAIGQDQREAEEALAGRQLNPANVDYACLCWSSDSVGDGPDSVSPDTMGWSSDLGSKPLGAEDFKCAASDIKAILSSVGVEADDASLKTVVDSLKGKVRAILSSYLRCG